MPDSTIDAALTVAHDTPTHEAIRDALIESRQRWRQFVTLAADLAFETDADGRFVFVMPDTALGWPRESLLGQPSELLLADNKAGSLPNPFCPAQDVRRYRSCLRSADGASAFMAISATPLRDVAGQRVGWRGIGIDVSNADFQEPVIATRLRRGEVLDEILARINRETSTGGMMDAALSSLIDIMGAEGAAVIGSLDPGQPAKLLHECGPGAPAVLEVAARAIEHRPHADRTENPDGRHVLAIVCPTRFGANAGLAMWRAPLDRPWDADDTHIAGAAVGIVRMILEYEAVHEEIAFQARTDPLTELLNRRAFLEELRRQAARLDRENAPGSMLYIDLDGFKSINDRLGHAIGDRVLIHLAERLRKLVRSNDLVARLGGDEFAVWLSGADHMTAAERADALCRTTLDEFQSLLPERLAGVGLSIGIATRHAGSCETMDDLMRRADTAMYEVKRSGRGHWRVSLLEGD